MPPSLKMGGLGSDPSLKNEGDFGTKYRSNFGEVDVAPAKTDKVNKVEK